MAEYKILVVDDEEPIAKILDFNLRKEGYDVIVANDGEKAVELAFSEDPDLILLDLMLPKKMVWRFVEKYVLKRIFLLLC